jgi:hypothetical protein
MKPARERIAETVAAVIGPDVRHVHNGATERVQNAIIERRSNQIADAVLPIMLPSRAAVAEVIDQHYEEDVYLPVYTADGELVSSAAGDAVLDLLNGEIKHGE